MPREDGPDAAVLRAFIIKLNNYEPGLVEFIRQLATPPACYIGYHNAPPTWILSNGEKPAEEKRFINASWDKQTRTFRGDILWDTGSDGVTVNGLEPAPTTFGGMRWWRYEMVFSEDYSSIVGGGNAQFKSPYAPPEGGVITGNEEVVSDMYSAFGTRLHYWRQGALPEALWR